MLMCFALWWNLGSFAIDMTRYKTLLVGLGVVLASKHYIVVLLYQSLLSHRTKGLILIYNTGLSLVRDP